MPRVSYQGVALAIPQILRKQTPPLGPGNEESAFPPIVSDLRGFAGLPFLRLPRRERPPALPEVVQPLPDFFLQSSAFRFRNLFCPVEQFRVRTKRNFLLGVVFLPRVKIGAVPSFPQRSLVYSPPTCPPSTSDSRNRPESSPITLRLRFSGRRRLSASPSRN